jgi:uncharacterized membrane protein YphA (DoxX/SURF4 family)
MKHSAAANAALWTLQVALAALFLFAGASKLAMPADELAREVGLPALFLQFIAVAEVAGGLGLILPGWVRVRRGLTPIAAAGLIVIMVGAVALSALRVSIGAAVFPLVVGLLLAVVVRGRRRWASSIPRVHDRRMDGSAGSAGADRTEHEEERQCA